MALWINPNNHVLDGGRASSAMEKEAVAVLARMFGWKTHLGHLCSGGTIANLEALWIAGNLKPGKKVIASQQAHYTHERICGVLSLPFESVSCDSQARLQQVQWILYLRFSTLNPSMIFAFMLMQLTAVFLSWWITLIQKRSLLFSLWVKSIPLLYIRINTDFNPMAADVFF